MHKKYSVLMSVYAAERPENLREAIESMLSQTIKTDNFTIVCDGPLTEGLNSILSFYLSKNPEIFTIVRIPTHTGLGEALRIGVNACKYELIARMDSDDISVPNRIQLQLNEFLHNPQLDLCGGQIAEFAENTSCVTGYRILPCSHSDIVHFAQKRNPINHMTVMFRKSTVLKAGNYRAMLLAEDYYLWMRMLHIGAKMRNLPDILAYARISDGMIERRGGLGYIKKMVCLQWVFLSLGLIGPHRFLTNCLCRAAVSIVPSHIRILIYKKALRKVQPLPVYTLSSQNFRIAMVVPSLSYKGPVIVAHRIACCCLKKGINITFISLRKNNSADRKRFKAFPLFELRMGRVPSVITFIKLKRLIRQERYAIVHAHSFYPSILVSFIHGITKFVTVHNNPHEDYVFEYGLILGNSMNALFKRRLTQYDEIISISNYVRKCISPQRSSIIYNGIEDLKKINDTPRIQDTSTIKLLCVSVLNKRKNVMTALKVVEQCIKNRLPVHCKIIGDGLLRAELEDYVKIHNLDSYIVFCGTKTHSYIYHLMQNSHGLLLTSKSEGFGLVVAEAFMCSCPVIVSDIPVMHEIVRDGIDGFICSKLSEYVEAIKKIQNDTSGVYRHNARQAYESRFRLSVMGRAYINLYKHYGAHI